MQKLTIKMQEALQSAQHLARQSSHSEIKDLHVLYELLQQDGGIVVPLLEHAQVNIDSLRNSVIISLDKENKVSGANAQPSMSYGLNSVIAEAESTMHKMEDSHLSVEHFILATLKLKSPAGKLLEKVGVSAKEMAIALKEIRGSQKVTDEDPEGKYQTLDKYGTDLTARARAGKIDPVIGRDDERTRRREDGYS